MKNYTTLFVFIMFSRLVFSMQSEIVASDLIPSHEVLRHWAEEIEKDKDVVLRNGNIVYNRVAHRDFRHSMRNAVLAGQKATIYSSTIVAEKHELRFTFNFSVTIEPNKRCEATMVVILPLNDVEKIEILRDETTKTVERGNFKSKEIFCKQLKIHHRIEHL